MRRNRKSPALFFAGLTLGALALAGCTSTTGTTASGETDTAANAASDVSSGYTALAYADLGIDEAAAVDESKAVDVTLADGASSADAGVSVDGDTVTITAAGTYRLSGSLSAGSVVVNVDSGQVNLILDGVSITSDETAAINVVSADSVVVYLADGSTNTLSDAATAATSSDEDAPTAVLYSKADLTIEGSGSLAVSASINDGITSKDSLIIEGGTISVDAADDGVNGKDHIVVLDGTLTINAGGDGIKSDNDEVLTDATSAKGVAWFSGGMVSVTAGDDGIQAERQLTVDGATLTVAAKDHGLDSEGVLSVSDGTVNVTESYEAMQGAAIILSGGEGTLVSSDDGINAAGGYLDTSSTATTGDQMQGGPGGDVGGGQPPSGDRGGPQQQTQDASTTADNAAAVTQPGGGGGMGGDPTVTDPSELTVSGASGGGMGGMEQGDSGSGRYLEISGGTWSIDAQGDGLDANGDFTMSGGTVTVQGPSANNNSAVDTDSFTVNGGTLTAVGSSGMLVTPSGGSQASVVAVFSGGVAAGSEVTLTDASGNVVATVTTERVSQALEFSSPDISSGATYTVTVAGTEVGTVTAS
jgi:hypothetical protein